MTAEERDELERTLRAACAEGTYEVAATLALRGYGPELLGFLFAMLRDEDKAGEAFSLLSEDLWRGLPGFAMRSSFRTWLYALGRHAALRAQRKARLAARGRLPVEALAALEEELRSGTLSCLRTAVKDRFAQLREALPADDQALLILRVDRGLEWIELAQVLSERGELEGEALRREAARLRKRFQVVKERLRALAQQAGLLKEREERG